MKFVATVKRYSLLDLFWKLCRKKEGTIDSNTFSNQNGVYKCDEIKNIHPLLMSKFVIVETFGSNTPTEVK